MATATAKNKEVKHQIVLTAKSKTAKVRTLVVVVSATSYNEAKERALDTLKSPTRWTT